MANQYDFESDNNCIFADIGAGYGLYLEKIEKLKLFDRIIGIEPSPQMAKVCRERGFNVIPKYVGDPEDIKIDASFTTAFEVIEHVLDPLAFLSSAKRILRRGAC